MKSVLISIQPPNTNNIMDGIKTIEWRTKPLPTGKHYCYETKKCFGLGKVIGEYHVWRVKKYQNVSMIPEEYVAQGCVPIEFLEAYSKGKPLNAHFILRPQRYDEPKELHHFFRPCGDCDKKGTRRCTEELTDCRAKVITRPPQSWCYVEGGGSDA